MKRRVPIRWALALAMPSVTAVAGCSDETGDFGSPFFPGSSGANSVAGQVFADLDEDGVFGAGDTPIAGAVVVWETAAAVVTDEDGYFSMSAPSTTGIVWVRGEDGFDPRPAWRFVDTSVSRRVDLGLKRHNRAGDLRFVAASDSHAGLGLIPAEDQRLVLARAAEVDPPPLFIAVTGDVTQGGAAEHFDQVMAAIAETPVPYLAVPGNHDLYDGGATYEAYMGPSNYSFAAGGGYFLMLDDSQDVVQNAEFLLDELPAVEPGQPVIASMHAPPLDEVADALSALGVGTLLTGHQHANRVLLRPGAVEYNTQPLTMAGIDATPAGFRVFTLSSDGELSAEHKTIVDEPVAVLAFPRAGDVLDGCGAPIVASVATSGDVLHVYADVDGYELELSRAGGWAFVGELADACPGVGSFSMSVRAETASGTLVSPTHQVSIEYNRLFRGRLESWPMAQGGPLHQGSTQTQIAPPLRHVWATAVGGHVQGGAPVVAGARVFVPVVDYADGQTGGVVCLDARTGALLWRHTTGYPVRNSPAVAGGVLVVAVNDGTVLGLDVETGGVIWDYPLAPHVGPVFHNIYSAPVITDGVAYVGINRELVALDPATGEPVWSVEPYDTGGTGSSYSTPAVGGGVVVGTFGRGLDGVMAWDDASGERLWGTSGSVSAHMNAPPLIDGDIVYAINESVQVSALDLHTGAVSWTRSYSDEGFPWAFGVMAPSALAEGRLFVPTQYGFVHAIDSATGVEIWSHAATTPGRVRASHYHGHVPAFPSAAVVTGGVVWVGEASGELKALDASSGELLWRTDFCTPILAGPAPAGEYLFVATYDGTVHALRHDELGLGATACVDASAN